MHPLRLLSIVCTHLSAFLLLSHLVPAQTPMDPKDAARYREELAPGKTFEARVETMKNVAYHNSLEAMAILLDGLTGSFKELESLEVRRAENDEALRKIIEPRMRAAQGGLIDYSGTEKFQEMQKGLGILITLEEQAVAKYFELFTMFTNPDVLQSLRKLRPKGPRRLALFLIALYGKFDQPLFTERLIELLSEKDLDLRIAAAESLSHHDPSRIPPQCYASILNAKEWEARAVAIDALGRHGGLEAVQLLVQRSVLEEGRLLTDVCDRLEAMTGQKLGKTGRAWLAWWEKNKEACKPTRVVLTNTVRAKTDAKTNYWGVAIDSLRVVFVIDISGTMQAALEDHENYFPPEGQARIDLARRELKAAITSLPSDALFNVIAYNDVVFRWQEKIQKADPKTKEKSFEWLDSLQACSATNIYDSLELAFQVVRPGVKDKYYDQSADTIVFLSDGGPTAGRSTDCDEILRQVREWNKTKKVVLHTIGIGKQLNQSFMKALAEQNFGECRFIQ